MAPRLNKRQLREQEELQALTPSATDPAEEQSEPESPVAPTKPPVVGFAAVSTPCRTLEAMVFNSL